jgi:hypothetical protein
MTRVASQLTFCSPDKIRRQSVVEIDEHQFISDIFSLETQRVESAKTLYYDGIISMEPISIKQQIPSTEIKKRSANYQYIDLSTSLLQDQISPTDKPLIIDFGTTNPSEINRLLGLYYPLLKNFTIFDIIASTVYYPAKFIGTECILKKGIHSKLSLWKGVDLVNKKMTEITNIVKIEVE